LWGVAFVVLARGVGFCGITGSRITVQVNVDRRPVIVIVRRAK
jgi:hypothetical protein